MPGGVRVLPLVLLVATTVLGSTPGSTAPGSPPNDEFDNATVVTQVPFYEQVDATMATYDEGEPTDCWLADRTVWYSMDVQAKETVQAAVERVGGGSLNEPWVALYRLDGSGLSLLGCGSSVSSELEPDQRYYVQVLDGAGVGTLRFSVELLGAIAGLVTDGGGDPLAGVCVQRFVRGGGNSYSWFGDPQWEAETDAQGRYRFENLDRGPHYLEFGRCPYWKDDLDPLYSVRWYDQGTDAGEADPVYAEPGGVTRADARLVTPQGIRGRVLQQDGEPFSGLCVDALALSGEVAASDDTAANGRYRLALPSGRYLVRFGCGDPRDSVEQWHAGRTSYEDADLVVVDTQETALKDVRVARWGRPPNDDIDAATDISTPFTERYFDLDATEEPSEPFPCGQGRGSVWYRLVASETRTLVAAASDAWAGEQPIMVSVYRGAEPSELVAIGCEAGRGAASVSFTISPGDTYWVQVASPSSGYGLFDVVVAETRDIIDAVATPTTPCAEACPYDKLLLWGTYGLPAPFEGREGACRAEPDAPPGSWADSTVAVPDTNGVAGSEFLHAILQNGKDLDLFLCATTPDRFGRYLVSSGGRVEDVPLAPLDDCATHCRDETLARVVPGETYIVRVFNYAGVNGILGTARLQVALVAG